MAILRHSVMLIKGSALEKLSQLQNIRHRRLMEPQDSPNRMEDACNQIPETLAGENVRLCSTVSKVTSLSCYSSSFSILMIQLTLTS